MDSYNTRLCSSRTYAILDLEAVEQPDGSYIDRYDIISWYDYLGELHREDGPAVIAPNGKLGWWKHGNSYELEDWLNLTTISDEDKMLLRLQYG
jgi:hypothetical protein